VGHTVIESSELKEPSGVIELFTEEMEDELTDT